MGVVRRRIVHGPAGRHRKAGSKNHTTKRRQPRGTETAADAPERAPATLTRTPPARTLTVEERLRVCFTLVEAVYQVNELAGEYDIIRVDEFAPDEVQDQIPPLMCALRGQLASMKAALPFECLSRPAPDVGDPRGRR
jgi:hypothetical protein